VAAIASGNGEQGRSLFIQCLLVEHVLSEAWTDALQVGDVLRDFLDGLHLLVKEFALQPVCHLTTTNNNQTYSEYKHVLANILRSRYVARTPPFEARNTGRRSNVENACHPPVTNQQRALTPRKLGFTLCCYSNATGALIANPPNSAELGGSLYHAQVTSGSVQ